ncbi:CRE-CIDS-2 protein [Aphelenchoides avenae]|nr:CRE-CIDS-2 protein [Aphelenchus avenae]
MPLKEDAVRKRLSTANASQESVQTISGYILHYKDDVGVIAKCWMDVYKAADDKLRTALIYVMNDAVQKASKKGNGETVTMAFHPHVINAIGMASPAVKKPIARCVEVFQQRSVFPMHIIEEMKAALDNRPLEQEEFPADLDQDKFLKDVQQYQNGDALMEKAREILMRSNFDFKSRINERMKDRSEGEKVIAEIDSSKTKLDSFLSTIDRHESRCRHLTEFVKQAKAFFNLQLRDVTIVDDAYEKFAAGMKSTKKQLEDIVKTGVLPGMTPPRDAPSPSPADDPFANMGAEGASEGPVAEDMEMDDDEAPGTSGLTSSLIPPDNYVPPVPVNSVPAAGDPRTQRSHSINTTPPTYSPLPADPRQSSRGAAGPPQSSFSQPAPPGVSVHSPSSMALNRSMPNVPQAPGAAQPFPAALQVDMTQPPPGVFELPGSGAAKRPRFMLPQAEMPPPEYAAGAPPFMRFPPPGFPPPPVPSANGQLPSPQSAPATPATMPPFNSPPPGFPAYLPPPGRQLGLTARHGPPCG